MARIAAVSSVAILDTSWLLELYQVPGYFKASRTLDVRENTADIGKARYELFVTVPVLFEVASHITHVRDGRRRRTLGKRLRDDITSSIDRESPWTITTVGREILLRSEDVLTLAEYARGSLRMHFASGLAVPTDSHREQGDGRRVAGWIGAEPAYEQDVLVPLREPEPAHD